MRPNELPADILREKQLSTEEVAGRMGSAKQNVSSFQLGRRGGSEMQIRRWAEAVGVSYDRAYKAIWRAVRRRGQEQVQDADRRLRGRPRAQGA